MQRLSLSFLTVVFSLVVSTYAYQPLSGIRVASVKDADLSGEATKIDIGEWLSTGKRLIVFGTYAADFNAIEYGQRLRHYWPKLQLNGVEHCAFILNCQPDAAKLLKEAIDLPDSIELWVDNEGEAGRAFGVERGWLPENNEVNPFLKLFGMLFGLGAWATLPAVIGGYIGNPLTPQPWIEDALAVGQQKGRWPDTALDLNADGSVKMNKFTELPLVGSWPRRPLELATLRLQSMIGISLSKWKELAPDEAALEAGVLTQLGGCLIVENDKPIYEWRDPGICAVVNFENVVRQLS